MPLYIVRFITTTEVIEREYQAPTTQACLDHAETHFRTWNAAHGELHEVVVCPPRGCGNPALEFYRLTEAGRRTIDDKAAAALAKMPAAVRRAVSEQMAGIRERRRRRF